MNLAPRAAAIRGDDYQHAVGWYWACQALDDPGIASVSIEDAAGGHFDDVVVRRRQSPDLYWQVKSSNYGSAIVDEGWLLTPATAAGRSPLQHFHATWRDLSDSGRAFELALLTNRGFDPSDPILRLRASNPRKSAPRPSPLPGRARKQAARGSAGQATSASAAASS